MSEPTILVTGATGRIGRHLVAELADANCSVRAMTRRPERASDLREHGATPVAGDFADPTSLKEALAGVDRMFLLSPVLQNMRTLQENVVAAAAQADVDYVVKLSAAGADAESQWDIARWHGQIEQRLTTADLAHTNLRPVFYMQNLLEAAERVRTTGVLARPAPPSTRINMVDTRDVAAVGARCLTDPNRVDGAYKLTGPRPIELSAVATALSDVLDRDVEYRQVSSDEGMSLLERQGSPPWLAAEQAALFEGFAKGAGDVETDAVERVLDRDPRSLETFVSDHAEKFRGA